MTHGYLFQKYYWKQRHVACRYEERSHREAVPNVPEPVALICGGLFFFFFFF